VVIYDVANTSQPHSTHLTLASDKNSPSTRGSPSDESKVKVCAAYVNFIIVIYKYRTIIRKVKFV